LTSMTKCGEPQDPHEISPYALQCPVCGKQQSPNVNLAELPEERAELQRRYEVARKDVVSRGIDKVADRFEQLVGKTVAVICVKFPELERLLSHESELKSTYYALADTRVPRAAPPPDVDWNAFREVVDNALFRDHVKQYIHFAVLSTSAAGPTAYGPCTLVCATKYIEKRASAFEKNSCQFFLERNGVPLPQNMPKGYRSTWADRGKLALAKLHAKLVAGMTDDEFAAVLLRAGATTADDDFVEVHICGPISAGTLEEVKIDDKAATATYAPPFLAALRRNLSDLELLKD
jgi:hypothetical protein